MREVNKIDRWIYVILVLLAVAAILTCGTQIFLHADISALKTVLSTEGQNVIDRFCGILSTETGEVRYSFLEILKRAFKGGTAGPFEKALELLLKFTLVPYALFLLSALLNLFESFALYTASVISSLAGCIALLVSRSRSISAALGALTPEGENGAEVIKEIAAGLKENPVNPQMGIGWWALLGGFLFMLILAGYAVVREYQHQRKGNGAGSVRGIRCGFGELKDAEIPMIIGKDVVIGSDAGRCNYITKENGIEAVHCRIRYIGEDCYEVTNLSREGIVIDGIRVVSSESHRVSSGKKLLLASKYIVDLL